MKQLDKKYNFIVIDKQTKEIISPIFNKKKDAQIWIEENGIDYDYFKIKELKHATT